MKEVLTEVCTHETEVTEDADEEITNEDKDEAQCEVALVVFLVLVFPHDSNGNWVQKVANTEDACQRREVGVNHKDITHIGTE